MWSIAHCSTSVSPRLASLVLSAASSLLLSLNRGDDRMLELDPTPLSLILDISADRWSSWKEDLDAAGEYEMLLRIAFCCRGVLERSFELLLISRALLVGMSVSSVPALMGNKLSIGDDLMGSEGRDC